MSIMLLDQLQAHEGGGFQLTPMLSWDACENGLGVKMIERLELATKTAMCFLARDFPSIKTHADSGTLSEKLKTIANSNDFKTNLKSLVQKADGLLHTDLSYHWASSTLKALASLLPKWSKNASTIYSDYCKWTFTPRPPFNGIVAFKDVVISFEGSEMRQLLEEEVKNCYVSIPHSLAYTPSDAFIEDFDQIFTTIIAGDMDAMDLEFSVEALSTEGKRLPHHFVVYYGEGGNAKGARSTLRATCYANGHAFVSPAVFDKSLKDEFRKQGHEFHGAVLCTLREGDQFEFAEKEFRAWTAGEGNGCRLPHAVHTPQLSWPCTGKFAEWNVKKTPKIPSIQEKSMNRRFKGIEKTASFTMDPEKVDVSKKIFLADPKLEDKLESGDAVWCYFRRHFWPWKRKHGEDDARFKIMNLTPSLQAQTDKLINILAENQGITPALPALAALTADGASFEEDPMYKMLSRCHREWKGSAFVKSHTIEKATWIPFGEGSRKGRVDYFRKALDSKWNWFFDECSVDSFRRAPFSDVSVFLELTPEHFGKPEDWLPFKGLGEFTADDQDIAASDVVMNGVDRDDSEPFCVPEIGHLSSVKEYAAMDIDRDQPLLQEWARILEKGRDLGDGWYEVMCNHYQAHDIPGRFIPKNRASLATITKEARAVSVQGRCKSNDLPLSHETSRRRLLIKNNLLPEFPQVDRFSTHFEAWRRRFGKPQLQAISYGGAMKGDACNPAMWTLQSQQQSSTTALLALPQYEYLGGMFANRPHPMYSRAFFMFSADECERITLARTDYDKTEHITRGVIYDELLTEGSSPELNAKHGLIEKPLIMWQDNFFMCLRKASERTSQEVVKLNGKRQCITIACLNAGDSKMQNILRKHSLGHGPHTYMEVQQLLASKRTGQYLEEATIETLDALPAADQHGYLLHCDNHCVGLQKGVDDFVVVSDASYANRVQIKMQALHDFLVSWSKNHAAARIVIFHLAKTTYDPSAYTHNFMLAAGM